METVFGNNTTESPPTSTLDDYCARMKMMNQCKFLPLRRFTVVYVGTRGGKRSTSSTGGVEYVLLCTIHEHGGGERMNGAL